mmetsp:Transcript_11661/g.17432  ORF Transcript_11661/g.17432 Transcript_11661/m.17432 type:complete len:107 (+) Transcript_11661:2-322(+)
MSEIKQVFQRAVELQRRGAHAQCLCLIDDLLEKNPYHARAWVLKSIAENSTNASVRAAEKAYSLRPDLECTRRALAAALIRCDCAQAKKKKFCFWSRSIENFTSSR